MSKMSYVVFCNVREGYLMKNGIFSHDIDAARSFDKKANAKRSAWYYGAEVVEFKSDRDEFCPSFNSSVS
ncbi:hypothetical protein ACTM43_22050 [Citrobacter freundii]|uniref:Ribulose bisphosphate carboxylase n=3 Tax=Enterobacteriaceae TaxID=543 RepID=A0A223DQI9_KLEPN|nr:MULTISPECIES: hypothetical protein [Citrobacter freundii complex]ASS84950.1 Ribulose bisphosphate carboxylase [Klebsiella pneumoniae]MBJ9068033.1 hypothetical protein [Citrobacter freundii]MCR3683390.1 hypothetical protein [Citrobacter freundii]NSL36172.1 hypothetical protein [Citrobacter werkmanii]HED2435659.1 hypothetical protein [Citrobacter freundii]